MLVLDYSRSYKEFRISKNWINKKLTNVIISLLKNKEVSKEKKSRIKGDLYLSVAVVDNKTIKSLNKKYRGKNKETDVLSFAEYDDKFVTMNNDKNDLGEIIISYPQIVLQSKEFNVSIHKEMERMLIHGFLHLIGYDHIKSKERKDMEILENNLVNYFNIK